MSIMYTVNTLSKMLSLLYTCKRKRFKFIIQKPDSTCNFLFST